MDVCRGRRRNFDGPNARLFVDRRTDGAGQFFSGPAAALLADNFEAPPGNLGSRGGCASVAERALVPEWADAFPDGVNGRWWVLHTRARNEKVVALALARQRLWCYLPLVRVQRTYSKRRLTVTLPLFPGYLFLFGGFSAREKAWDTKRVASILHVEDQNRLRAELRQIHHAVESGESVGLFPALRKGRRCRIASGTLRGLEGVIIRRGGQCRMYLTVTILGQSAVVEIDGALLEVID